MTCDIIKKQSFAKFIFKILIFFFLCIPAAEIIAQEPARIDYQKLVEPFVTAVRNNDKIAVAKLIKYPLSRGWPVPSIKNDQEMIVRFDQVFDEALIKEITTSSIHDDWSEMGWRGIMLNNGTVWIDFDGTVIGINHHSAEEKRIETTLIERQRQMLHPSLKQFETPELVLETEKYLIRIDELSDGTYRYAVWPKGTSQSEKPALIIRGGEYQFDGNGGNYFYLFHNGSYEYMVYIAVISDGSSPGELVISKSGKVILHQDIVRFVE